jgi:hypothetical protein
MRARLAALADRMAEARRHHPEGSLGYLEADLRTRVLWIDTLVPEMFDGIPDQCRKTISALRSALDAPTLLPRSVWRFDALCVLMWNQIILCKLEPDPGPGLMFDLRKNMLRLVEAGRGLPLSRIAAARKTVEVLSFQLVEWQATRWKDRAALVARWRQLQALGNYLLAALTEDSPFSAGCVELTHHAHLQRMLDSPVLPGVWAARLISAASAACVGARAGDREGR